MSFENEQLAIFMLVDELTGLAPGYFQSSGVGRVVMARTDGKDLSVRNIRELNNYLHSLMDLWPELDLNKAKHKRRLEEALSPQSYQQFTQLYPS